MGNAVQQEMGMAEPLPGPAAQEAPRKPQRRWTLIAIVAALVASIAATVVFYRPTHDQIAGPPLLKADARELKSTIVRPHLEEPILPGKNVLWCSTFQLAWNEGCRSASGDIHLDAEPPMVSILNKKNAKATDLDPNSCVAMAGAVDAGIIPRIRQELDRKFHGQASPDLLDNMDREIKGMPDAWLMYAYLFRDLPFEHVFERLKKPLAFGSAQVASFGLSSETPHWHQPAGQVSVLDYGNDDDFILKLWPKEQGESILLAKITPAETIEKTISNIRKRIAAPASKHVEPEVSCEEPLAIPILNFDLWREYVELEAKKITTPGSVKDMKIFRALQSIRFRLDERGAVLKSEAAGAVPKSAAQPWPPKPRHFIFDKPFLILLERTGAAQPYFALWVDNAELLVPYK
jgi:hypothetical protein